MNTNSELDIAWAAGLFEGEGSAYVFKSQNRPTVELSSTDEDVVNRFYDIVGVGNIYRVDRGNSKHKVFWRWATSRKDDVIVVLELLLPHLGTRRTQEALKTLECAKSKSDYKKRMTKKEEVELLTRLGLG